MKCPFELPVKLRYGDLVKLLGNCNNAEYIVAVINSHEKLFTIVQNLVNCATKYPNDYATKDLNELIPFLIKEAKQALKEEKP